ncbi:chaperone modulator CbpM [Agrobacterium sp. SORGH_AS 787]|uniref:chaperone modulator CbpM n=1 Tax=Agrobacterium sp. SORGH_AS 787 TaxID=3041775 RepID=UPI002780C527|nr:chaperone modulatory protein CbpM [Rhizobium sp. SORGH_AS_0787]
MMNQEEFAHNLQIDIAQLRALTERGWISPLMIDGQETFRDVDQARAELIADLTNEMGINDDGVEAVLALLDQLYSLRHAVGDLIDTLEGQPLIIRRRIVAEVQKRRRLAHLRSRPRR